MWVTWLGDPLAAGLTNTTPQPFPRYHWPLTETGHPDTRGHRIAVSRRIVSGHGSKKVTETQWERDLVIDSYHGFSGLKIPDAICANEREKEKLPPNHPLKRGGGRIQRPSNEIRAAFAMPDARQRLSAWNRIHDTRKDTELPDRRGTWRIGAA